MDSYFYFQALNFFLVKENRDLEYFSAFQKSSCSQLEYLGNRFAQSPSVLLYFISLVFVVSHIIVVKNYLVIGHLLFALKLEVLSDDVRSFLCLDDYAK